MRWPSAIGHLHLREHLTQGYTLNRQRFEANARELEAALQLVKKAAQSPELLADTGRGLVDIVTRWRADLSAAATLRRGIAGRAA